MPSAEDTTYLFEVMPDAGISQESFGTRDVDVLVSRIKQNLRLSSLKSRSSLAAHTMRASPYRLQHRDGAQQQQHHHHHHHLHQQHQHHHHQQQQQHHGQEQHPAGRKMTMTKTTNTTTTTTAAAAAAAAAFNRRCVKAAIVRTQLDDSYECFQALLRKGALIKEAVKRLQTCPEEEYLDEGRGHARVVGDVVVDEEEEDDDEFVDNKRRATSATLDSMDDEDDEDDD